MSVRANASPDIHSPYAPLEANSLKLTAVFGKLSHNDTETFVTIWVHLIAEMVAREEHLDRPTSYMGLSRYTAELYPHLQISVGLS